MKIPVAHYALEEKPKANTEHIKNKLCDIPYSSMSVSQMLDIYFPDAEKEPYPVIIWVHGGAFMGGDKADTQVLPALEALKRGYAVVSVNYRMSGEALFPALIHDMKAAIRWIRANAGRFSFNPDKVAVWGASAGGYIASFTSVSDGVSELEDLKLGNSEQRSNVQAAVIWFGPTDFLKMDEQLGDLGLAPDADKTHSASDSPESLLMGRKITEIPDLVRKANPETYISPSAPPFLLQHGTADSTVPVQQSINFAAKLEKVLGKDKVALELLEGAVHADEVFETPGNIKKVLDFLDKQLK